MDSLTNEDFTKLVCVFRISVENQMPRAAKETLFDIGDVTCNLGHPRIVGVGCDAGDVDRSGGDVDEEQDVIRDQPLDRVHLDAHEIGRCQAFPVGLEKRRPAGVLVAFGSGLDAIFSEYIGDRGPADLMSQIGQCALDSRIPPRSVFNGHAQQ